MKRALVLVFALVAVNAIAQEAQFSDEKCAISFSYPRTWTAQVADGDRVYTHQISAKDISCTIGLAPPGWTKRREESLLEEPEFAVNLVVTRLTFLDAAEKAGFVRTSELSHREPTGARWAILVRQGADDAEEFLTKCCQALRGVSWSHTWGREDQVATTFTDVAVLNNRRRRSVIIAAEYPDEFAPVVTLVVKTLELP